MYAYKIFHAHQFTPKAGLIQLATGDVQSPVTFSGQSGCPELEVPLYRSRYVSDKMQILPLGSAAVSVKGMSHDRCPPMS